jgi:hypothetical protein
MTPIGTRLKTLTTRDGFFADVGGESPFQAASFRGSHASFKEREQVKKVLISPPVSIDVARRVNFAPNLLPTLASRDVVLDCYQAKLLKRLPTYPKALPGHGTFWFR